ncbi:MAG: hypothetical protein IKG21_13265 [Atopobiaceae bacterium]|nr:hypothetical protein [Atopobiaceae bacterium]
MDEQTKATISAAIVLAVNIAALFGASLDLGVVQNAVFGTITIATTLYATWKNHNFTEEAVQAQELLDELKGK